ncbi:MAG: gamma-glutamyltransferase, partial [Pyrinomonadaceae bacterium]
MSNRLKRFLGSVLIVASWAASLASTNLRVFAQRDEPVRARRAMVASQHELASRIGVEIMKKGGNAVDAAIAVGLALAVVYPEAGNIGGGGFMLIRSPNGETHAIDYRETAPAASGRNMYVDKGGNIITGLESSTVGYRASGVPGTLSGFDLAFRQYGSGKVKWSELVRPARLLAANGFELSYRGTKRINEYKDSLAQFEDSKRIFLNLGKLFTYGDVLRQPDLAMTLDRIERIGAREFYTGLTARLIADDMKAKGGLITLDDLRNYQAKERVPVRGTYRGNEIISMSPPSSGGTVMLEILNMLEGYDLRAMKYNSAASYHLVAEAMRRAFADRSEFMGDPDFAIIPTAGLLSKEYAKRQRSTIDPARASTSDQIGHGLPAGGEPTETTHFTVVDASGMAVSNSYTINDLFGSRVTARGTGILLNDEMDDFASKPGTPNLYGLIQGEQNAIKPGKKPLSSMTPTIVLRKDGSFWFALGGRGGPHIISAVVQSIINVIDHDMNLQQAIDAPRIHHQWLPDDLLYEPLGMSPDTLSILGRMGHHILAASNPDRIASTTGIMIDETGTRL